MTFKVSLYSDFEDPIVFSCEKEHTKETSFTLFEKAKVEVDIYKLSILDSLFCVLDSNPYITSLDKVIHNSEAQTICNSNDFVLKEKGVNSFDIFDSLEPALVSSLSFKTMTEDYFEERLNLGIRLYGEDNIQKEQLEVIPLIFDIQKTISSFQETYPAISNVLLETDFFTHIESYLLTIEPYYSVTFSLEKVEVD